MNKIPEPHPNEEYDPLLKAINDVARDALKRPGIHQIGTTKDGGILLGVCQPADPTGREMLRQKKEAEEDK